MLLTVILGAASKKRIGPHQTSLVVSEDVAILVS